MTTAKTLNSLRLQRCMNVTYHQWTSVLLLWKKWKGKEDIFDAGPTVTKKQQAPFPIIFHWP